MTARRTVVRARILAGVTAAALGLAGLAVATPAAAAPIECEVTTAAGDNSAGSLGDCINQTNANAGADTIVFDLVAMGSDTITLTADLPVILEDVTITGPGSGDLTISSAIGGLFEVSISADAAEITGLNLLSTVDFGIEVGDDVFFTGADLTIDAVGRDVTCQGCSLDLSNSTFIGAQYGVYWYGDDADDQATLTGVNGDQNSIAGAYLLANDGSTATINNSGFDLNTLYGVLASGVNGGHLDFNGADAFDNGSTGLYIATSDTATADITDSFLESNPLGLYLSTTGDSVVTGTGNTVEGAGNATPDTGIGILAADASQVTLTGSLVRLNDTGLSLNSNALASITFDGETHVTENTSLTTSGGGVVIAGGQSTVLFDGALFDFNNGANGAGLMIQTVLGAAVVTIQNSTIDNNTAINSGGGLAVMDLDGSGGSVALTDSFVRGNTANAGNGGGVYLPNIGGGANTSGGVSIVRTTIDDNDAPGSDAAGGGIYAAGLEQANSHPGAIFSLIESTVSRNTAMDGGGGGLWIQGYPGPSVTLIESSTISGNEVAGVASGLWFGGTTGDGDEPITTLRLLHSTVADNFSSGDYESIRIFDTEVELAYTIVTTRDGNADVALAGPGDDSAVDAIYSTFQFLPPVLEPLFAGDHVRFGIDPKLGPLQNNGGPTETHYLLAGSPAIDTGDPAFTPPPATDQRGDPRVVNIIDIGAVEIAAALPATGGELNAGWAVLAILLLAAGAAAIGIRRFVLR